MNTPDSVKQKVKAWQERLIELNRRNTLYSLPATNRGLFPISQFEAAKVFGHLSTSRHKLVFELDLGDDLELTSERSSRNELLIKLPQEQFKKIDNLRLRSSSTFREQGIVTLYLACGLLQWFDAKSRDATEAVRSPLILMPVQLTRLPGGVKIELARMEDDLELNPTLVYRLSRPDLRIELPPLPDEDGFNLNGYLDSVREALKGNRTFTVLNDVYLGRFSFLKMAMYRDLERNMERACQHPVVAALAGDIRALAGLPMVAMAPLDALDEEMAGAPSNCVLDADPSQQRAILAARAGQSFVLQGPPGTGKTQTIANIISECMAAGKRVLFVSQKMAALDAVFKRLKEKGLNDLCLEAHSYKADKKQIVAQLKSAFESQKTLINCPEFDTNELDVLENRLSNVVSALHVRRQPLGVSIYQVNGILASLQEIPDLPFTTVAPETVNHARLAEMEELAQRLAKHHSFFNEAATHPWRGVKATRFTLDFKTQVETLLEGLLESLLTIQRDARELTEVCGEKAVVSLYDCLRLVTIAALLAKSPRPPASWLTDSNLRDLRTDAAAHQALQNAHQLAREQVTAHWLVDVLTFNHDELLAILSARDTSVLQPLFGRSWQDAVPVRFIKLQTAVESLKQQAAGCGRTLELLNERLGLRVLPTLSEEANLIQVCELVCAGQRPLPEWFALESIDANNRLALEAAAECERIKSSVATLTECYDERIFEMDAELLSSRFDQDYAGFARWFNRQFYLDRRALRRCTKPGVRRSFVDLAADVRILLIHHRATRWLNDRRESLQRAFGTYFRGVDTNWESIHACLRTQTNLLHLLPKGDATTEIIELMTSAGPYLNEVREIYEQFSLQVTAQQSSLDAVKLQISLGVLGFTDLPVKQANINQLNEWLATVVDVAAKYDKAFTQCASCSTSAERVTSSAILAMLQSAQDIVQTEQEMLSEKVALEKKFVGFYAGLETNWETILTGLDWSQRLVTACGGTTPAQGIVNVAVNGQAVQLDRLAELARNAASHIERYKAGCQNLDEFFPAGSIHNTRPNLADAGVQSMQDWLELRLNRLPEIESWIGFQNLNTECSLLGMVSFYETVLNRKPAEEHVLPAFRKRFYQLWYDSVMGAEPVLRQFRGDSHAELITKFREIDRWQIASASTRIKHLIRQRAVNTDSNFGEVGALKKVLAAKRPKSIRKILADIPNALFQYKPCLLMSPLSVSLYLESDALQIDVVVFDEASQIFVEDALCSLLRAKQVIIAGDTKQLPPTNFFASLSDDPEDDTEDQETTTYESILQAASGLTGDTSSVTNDRGVQRNAAHFAEHELTWHYRSQNESLIAFSREHFYTRIVAFPAPTSKTAVSWLHVPDGIYYPGDRKRNNPVEAALIVNEVLKCALENPTSSIGVITFNEPQRNLIQQLIEEKTAKDSVLARRLDESGIDGFFVKNIENVQGDERDVIFLGLGFGPTTEGTVSNNFGPINREGGERRLNVAVTRARCKMTVVSSIQPSDIQLKSNGADGSVRGATGPKLLRSYLEYAQSGGQTLPSAADDPSRFESAVAAAVSNLGYEVKLNVGRFGYTVNIGIVHPNRHGEYLLGIECDGPTYRDAETVRARDRLREEVLNKLGWSLHRVWSCDWINNPAREVAKIEEAIRQCLNPRVQANLRAAATLRPAIADSHQSTTLVVNATNPSSIGGTTEAPSPVSEVPSTLRTNNLIPGTSYFKQQPISVPWSKEAIYDKSDYGRKQVSDLILRLIETNGPMAEQKAMQVAADCVNISRVGPRVEAALQNAISYLISSNRIERRKGFLYPYGITGHPARVAEPGIPTRPIDEICLEEIGEVILALLRSNYGAQNDELLQGTARLFGFLSTSQAMRDRIQEAIAMLELDGRIDTQGGQVRAVAGA